MPSYTAVRLTLAAPQHKMFKSWSMADPVDDWERLRNTRIEAAPGNKNPFVK